MKYWFSFIVFTFFPYFNMLNAQSAPFNTSPDWTSLALNHVATGIGVADINQDGWDDIMVANGNDIHRQSVVVYYNDGTGSFPLTPSWSSFDIDYHGHLSIGDINKDNFPDLIIGNYSSQDIRLMFNNGDGSFSEGPIIDVKCKVERAPAVADINGDHFCCQKPKENPEIHC